MLSYKYVMPIETERLNQNRGFLKAEKRNRGFFKNKTVFGHSIIKINE